MTDWQPIETAPRDEIFLGFWQYVHYGDKSRTCGMSLVEWDECSGFWETFEDDNYRDGQFQEVFSHWMPLPEPPQETNT